MHRRRRQQQERRQQERRWWRWRRQQRPSSRLAVARRRRDERRGAEGARTAAGPAGRRFPAARAALAVATAPPAQLDMRVSVYTFHSCIHIKNLLIGNQAYTIAVWVA